MVKKFIVSIIVSLLLFASVNRLACQQDNKTQINDIKISLYSNVDTCYYSNDRIVISVKFNNNGFSALKINKNTLVTTKDIQKIDVIKIYIRHDGNLYEYAFLDGKEAIPKCYNLSMKKSFEIKDIINFRQLATKMKIDAITNFSTTKIDNIDFGIYQLQALYIKNSNDTIFSNWITVSYFNK